MTTMRKSEVGELRPSQVLTTFGIGSQVDLPNLSVMVMELESWPDSYCTEIAVGERRCSLAARLECDEATVWRTCERYRQDGLASLFADGRQGHSGRVEQFAP